MSRQFATPVFQSIDTAGIPRSGALLYFYQNGTTTPQAVYSDNGLTTPLTNPVVADSGGQFPVIYLQNAQYTAKLTDSSGAVVWSTDNVDGRTSIDGANIIAGSVPLSALAGGSVFPVGIPFPWPGAVVPTGFLLCYGQAISRTDYPLLYANLGTTWGIGDGSTTFNLPDLRGRVIAGLDGMGGSAANRVTSGISGINGNLLGSTGGDERVQQHNHTLTDPGHFHVIHTGGAAGTGLRGDAQGSTYSGNSDTATTGITLADFGGGNSQNMQPTAIMNWIVQAA